MWTEVKIADRNVRVFGREIPATVYIDYCLDEESVDGSFDFGDEKTNARYLARFERGTLLNVCIRVRAVADDFVGEDYLGACHVRTANDTKDILACVDDHAMVSQALQNLAADMESTKRKLDKLAGVAP